MEIDFPSNPFREPNGVIEPLHIEVIGEIVDLPKECPLMVSWSHLLHKRLNANTVPNFGAYMEILGNATDENFIQQPYQRLSHTLLGEGYERYAPQLAKACSIALCINYHTVVPHKPNNYARQFGFENINLDSIPELPDVVVEVRPNHLARGLMGRWGPVRPIEKKPSSARYGL
ncbi:hypothetical protein PRUPE_5G202300 [Prunus persica]|uniref:Uncharacterized protein n=1 Tax=Prunus persica TaxID=3760 RepID=A0A251PB51_PRUPE|nr:uncharacterized protein LOC109949077 [Prunus persica]ONI08817.1 hypothetical protein PRUPE_5G202300 [Prunus persica]